MSRVRFAIFTDRCLKIVFNNPSQPTFAKFDRVKFGSDDDLLAAVTGPDVDSFGYVYQQNGTEVSVIVDGDAQILVAVDTGQIATRGKFAMMTSANKYGLATAPGGGTTALQVAGRFMASGIAGDQVSMLIGGVNLEQVHT